MSCSKRWFEESNPDPLGDGNVEDCNTPESIPAEDRLFFAGDDAELNDALDQYLTRTPSHPADEDTQ